MIILSIQGSMKNKPGPLASALLRPANLNSLSNQQIQQLKQSKLPSLKMTALSYSFTILMQQQIEMGKVRATRR